MRFYITTFLLLIAFISNAQNKYLLLFKDKTNSPYSIKAPEKFLSTRAIQRRATQNIAITERDLPPNPAYIQQVRSYGAKIFYTSRWLNAALIETSYDTLQKILKLSFVKGIEGNGDIRNARVSDEEIAKIQKEKFEILSEQSLGFSQNQLAMIGADKMQEQGYKGEGILIGVLDSGFQNADRLSFFQHLFTDKRIIDTYDFVNQEKDVYNDHNHGTNVLSCMAAYQENTICGTAPKASYVLLKTEDVTIESRIEEANWLFGAEYADSVGVDVINSSLGYSDGFTNPNQNHKLSELDGNTTLITRAADWAAATGIVVVNSAGNEGNNEWQYISAPADADSIISVGAVNSQKEYAYFSSLGYSPKGKIKPELAAQGQSTAVGLSSNSIGYSNGTSFSSPLIAGLVAGFKQAFPNLTNMQIRDYLIRSASQYTKPDNKLGYGIPNFVTASEIAKFDETIKKSGKELFLYPNPFDENGIRLIILKDNIGNEFEVSLIDNRGSILWQKTTTEKNFVIPANSLREGIYYVRVRNEQYQGMSAIVRH